MSAVIERREALLDALDQLTVNRLTIEGEDWGYRRYRDFIDETSIFQPAKSWMLPLDLHRDCIMAKTWLPIAADVHKKVPISEIAYGPTFLEAFASTTNRTVASKADNELILSAIFGPDRNFCRDNLVGAVGVWFDFDGDGEITPDEVASIFSEYRMYFYSTYSSTVSEPRWRAFLETDYIMPGGQHDRFQDGPQDLYWLVKARLMRILAEHGWYAKKEMATAPEGARCHGFDDLTLLPETKIYMPCVPIDPAAAMSIKLTENRKPIPLFEWLESGYLDAEIEADQTRSTSRPAPIPRAPAIDPSTPIAEQDGMTIMRRILQQQQNAPVSYKSRDERIKESVAIWAKTSRGECHRAFFNFGYALARQGLSPNEVQELLHRHAYAAGGTGAERVKQIPQIIAKLTRDGLFVAN